MAPHTRPHAPSRLRSNALAALIGALAAVFVLGGTATAAHLITSADIKNHTIKLKDISKKAQESLGGAAGGATYVQSNAVSEDNEGRYSAQADCPSGQHVLSGGGQTTASYAEDQISSSYPVDTNADSDSSPDNAWVVKYDHFTNAGETIHAWVVCG